jgi:single-stranded-DNA-specific exonuclease
MAQAAALLQTRPPRSDLRAVTGPTQRSATRVLQIDSYDLDLALTLERELGVSHVLSQILVRRGLGEPDVARAFLEADVQHEPTAFAGIEQALAVIESQIGAGGQITVHGDYDVDGVCATAIMVRALRTLGANVGWFLPARLDDGYGLGRSTVQRLAARGTSLILTVDCAITAVDEIAVAHQAGVEVVVSDHHAPRADGRLPDCPIVHPAVCGYPCEELCGTAVAYKLAQALGARTADADLDLVALATVADLVPLLDENRRLVREGLVALASTAKPGLRALMSVSRVDPSALDSGTLGFRLAPRINAAGRVRRPDAGLELLLTEDPRRAREIAFELDAYNTERRAVEQRILWEAEAQVNEFGCRTGYVLASEDWHPGVVGIVASRIAERHHRPAVLVALAGDHGTGSGRGIPGFDLLGALHACAPALERYGGHRAAAGLTIARSCLDDFRAAFELHTERVLTPDLLEPCERVDAIVSGSVLGLELADELERLEPCGMGNPAPRLLVPGALFTDVRPMGEGRHARFCVSSGGVRARAVAFGCEGRLAGGAREPRDATFKLERNTWNGAVEPRVVLRHEQRCAPPAIEVLGEPSDYLAAVLAELASSPEPEPRIQAAARRTVLDRRGESALTVLGDAVASGKAVLALCADVPRRLAGLQARTGGFALACHQTLHRNPALAQAYDQLVVLDPPALRGLATQGRGYTYLAWSDPELRFAQQMHELEYGLRASLVALFTALRERKRAAGEELESLLRGDGPHGRSARLAARLVRVLAELELVSLDRHLPALEIASVVPTTLDRSSSYRVYAQRYEDGLRYLSSANQPLSV